jgi:hypothetical protein
MASEYKHGRRGARRRGAPVGQETPVRPGGRRAGGAAGGRWGWPSARIAPTSQQERELGAEVFDVEGQDLFGPGRRFVEEPPQEPFPQREAVVGEEFLEPGLRDGAVVAMGGLGGIRRRAGLVARRFCRWAQVVKEISADRCRFQVAAAAPVKRGSAS